MSQRSNTLNIPKQVQVPSNSSTKGRESSEGPKLKRTVSQLFHGTKKWGSFSKSTIKKKKRFIDGFNSSSISLTEGDDNYSAFCNFFNFLPIFHPVGPLKCVWDGIVMVMLIYTSVEIPYTLSFEIDLTLDSVFGIIAFCIDIFLCIDIIFNFRTAYFDKFDTLKLIINPTVIAKRYLRGWFIIDLVTSIPIEFIVPNAVNHFNNVTTYIKILRIFRLIRVVKILRLLKIVKLFDGVMKRIVVREMLVFVRLLKIVSFMLLYAHLSACLWYFIGCESHKKYGVSWISEHTDIVHQCDADSTVSASEVSSIFTRYSYAWYWSVVTLFTTGYGDITAENIPEQWVASISILIGTCFFAYFIGTLTTLISEGDRISSEIMSKMEEAQHFCDKKKLPREMTRAVLTHTRYHCNYNCILDEQSVLGNLPPYLQMDISLYISKSLMLSNIDFFNEKILDPAVRGAIAMRMRSISCNNGYKLYSKDDLAKEIYIQRTGRSIHLVETKRGRKKKIKLNRGDICGEYSLVLKKRVSTVLCATWCEFYVIEINDIMEVLQQYYGNRWEKKWSKMKKFVKKEYMLPTRWRKKRHVSPHIGSQHSGEGQMHALWDNTGKSIQSTIRSEGVKDNPMFKNIFNDQNDLENVFSSRYSDMMLSDGVIEEGSEPNDTDKKEESLTTESEFLELVKLDQIKPHDPAVSIHREGKKSKDIMEFDPSPRSIARMRTTSTIDELRYGPSGVAKPTKSQSFDDTKQAKSARKAFEWLGSLRMSIDVSAKRESTKTKEIKKKGPKKKKKKTVWFGSMRQNSELRDKAVVATDTMDVDMFREMFSDYKSGTDDDSGSDDVIFDHEARSKTEHQIMQKEKEIPDWDLAAISAPNVAVNRKQRSQSEGKSMRTNAKHEKHTNQSKLRKHIRFHSDVKKEKTPHTEPPDIQLDDGDNSTMRTVRIVDDEYEDVIFKIQPDDSNTYNTDSISVGGDLSVSNSSDNTLRSEPQPHSIRSVSRATAKSSANKVSGGKFKVKKHMKKGGGIKKSHATIMKSHSHEKRLNIKDLEHVVESDDNIDETDLPNTSMAGFVTMSDIEENMLINKSFCISTKSYVSDGDMAIHQEENKDVTNHLVEVFRDNNDNINDINNDSANKANYVDD